MKKRFREESFWEQLADFTIFLMNSSRDDAIQCICTRAIVDDRDLLYHRSFDDAMYEDGDPDEEYLDSVYRKPLMNFDPEFMKDINVSPNLICSLMSFGKARFILPLISGDAEALFAAVLQNTNCKWRWRRRCAEN